MANRQIRTNLCGEKTAASGDSVAAYGDFLAAVSLAAAGAAPARCRTLHRLRGGSFRDLSARRGGEMAGPGKRLVASPDPTGAPTVGAQRRRGPASLPAHGVYCRGKSVRAGVCQKLAGAFEPPPTFWLRLRL